MKQTCLLMGMPITLAVADQDVAPAEICDAMSAAFAYLSWVDETFSTYKETSEISRLNRGELAEEECCEEVREALALAEQTRLETDGYFDVHCASFCDPSGIVKGWAARNAAGLLVARGLHNFYLDAGGDIQATGANGGAHWRVGIRNPFNRAEHVKVLAICDRGVATSGTAIRGQHIYDPYHPDQALEDVVSVTVVGPDIYEADRFATAAFAMGRRGVAFIEERAGLEAYQIDAHGIATYTSGFARYVPC